MRNSRPEAPARAGFVLSARLITSFEAPAFAPSDSARACQVSWDPPVLRPDTRTYPDALGLRNGDPGTMMVLVAYASRHGATEGIAARIAGGLVDSGATVDLRHVDHVEGLDGYGAVVFGAPVYDQSWPPEADRFIAAYGDGLAARPLWLFSVGAFGDTKRLIGPVTRKEPKRIAEICAAVRPREYRVFQGVIRKHQWPFWSRVFFHAFGGRFGDHRDWPVIDAWAERIGVALASPCSASPV
jgi:menaquinone-dependent protoporphyrinogen oxidase